MVKQYYYVLQGFNHKFITLDEAIKFRDIFRTIKNNINEQAYLTRIIAKEMVVYEQ